MIQKLPVPWALLLLLCLFSCSSQRQLNTQRQRAREISRQVGFTVHPKENLALYEEVISWLGTPYKLGGTSRQGVDCSGYVREIYRTVYRKPLNRTVNAIYAENIKTIPRRKLETGDLVFFNFTQKRRTHSHIGIYLKKGYFTHAGSSSGVAVHHLSTPYFKKGWTKSGRVKR